MSANTNIDLIRQLYSLDESNIYLTLDYHTFDFDEHIAQIFCSNNGTEIVVEEYVSKNFEFIPEDKTINQSGVENVFDSIAPNGKLSKLLLDEEEVPDIPFEETPKSEAMFSERFS